LKVSNHGGPVCVEFTILIGDGSKEPLWYLEVDYAEKTRGVFVAMDGNKKAEMKI